MIHGRIQNLTAEAHGDELAADAALGASTIYVGDVADFIAEDRFGVQRGGSLRIDGVVYTYTAVDDATGAISGLTPTLAAAQVAGVRVDLWDAVTQKPVIEYVADISEDGVRGSGLQATVPQEYADKLAGTTRGGVGESVTLVRKPGGDDYTVAKVHGKQVAVDSSVFLAGGFTTRADSQSAGMDIDGTGVRAYAPPVGSAAPVQTFRVDSATGNMTAIGELGTAAPGEVGVFINSSKFSYLGAQVTTPKIELNVGATRDQPTILSDTVGTSNLYLRSGAGTGSREAQAFIGAGEFNVGIESSPNDGLYGGGRVIVKNSSAYLATDSVVGPGSTDSAQVQLTSDYTLIGYLRSSTGATRGFEYLNNGTVDMARVLCANGMDVVNVDATIYKPVTASAFTVPSDEAFKSNLDAVAGALDQLDGITAYDYDLADGSRNRGVIAQDVDAVAPVMAVEMNGLDDGPPMLGVDLYGLLATTVAAVKELRAEVAELRARVATLEGAAP